MDDGIIKIVLYIALGIFWLFFKGIKKQKQVKKQETGGSSTPPSKTLEEMLAEYNKSTPSPTVVKQSSSIPKKKLEKSTIFTDEGEQVSQKVKQIYKSIELDKLEVLKTSKIDYEIDGVQISASDKKISKEYETKVKQNYYASLFKNPKSIRDAIVIGEIMNRRF